MRTPRERIAFALVGAIAIASTQLGPSESRSGGLGAREVTQPVSASILRSREG